MGYNTTIAADTKSEPIRIGEMPTRPASYNAPDTNSILKCISNLHAVPENHATVLFLKFSEPCGKSPANYSLQTFY
jgi:hypothetical protein